MSFISFALGAVSDVASLAVFVGHTAEPKSGGVSRPQPQKLPRKAPRGPR